MNVLMVIRKALAQPLATVLPYWLPAITVITFLLFGLDKALAKRKKRTRRIPERTLFLLSISGGSIGALAGMILWNHKTRHTSFRIGIPAIMLLQALLALFFLIGIP